MDTFIRALKFPSSSGRPFGFLYLIVVIFTFHTLLTAYSSSTYLERFTTPEAVGLLYALGSAIAVILFFLFPLVLSRLGNTRTTLLCMSISISALTLLGLGVVPLVAFVVFQALNPLLYLNIDVFSEQTIGENESETGRRRGLALSLASLAAVFAPLTMGLIVGEAAGAGDPRLAYPYFAAAGVGLVFMGIVVYRFRYFADPQYPTLRIATALVRCFKDRNLRGVVSAHFLLQCFFSWIVIYFPLYLATALNMPWSSISLIIAAGLVAYVLFEYPVGLIADRYIGEKEMMAIGFLILALTSAAISFIPGTVIAGWMALMFMSRVGASLVEVTTESYFFKRVDGGDAQVISLFRVTRPLANLVGAMAGSAALGLLPFELIFVLLGLAMVPGILLAATLVDTK